MTTWTAHSEATLLRLLLQGRSIGEISVMLGRSIDAVRWKLREMGVKR